MALGLLVGVGKLALGIVGFTGYGIRAGSYAAIWMAKIGIVAAGSIFSVLQAFAMA